MKPKPPGKSAALRRTTEARRKKKRAPDETATKTDLRRIQHELEVHQIELEAQNEELRAAQEVINAGLERYTELFDYAPVGYFNLNADSVIQLVNLTGAKLVNVERSRLLGRRFRLLVTESDRRNFDRFLTRVFSTDAGHTCEFGLAAAAGSVRLVRLDAARSLDAKECRAVLVDITERRQAEVLSQRLAAIVASSDDAIVSKDLSSIITSWNRGAERIFGYTPGEMIGTSIRRLIPADRQEEENQILGMIKRGENLEHFETLRQTKGGRLINVSITASPIHDSAGMVIGVSKVVRDITARKLVEGKLAEERNLLRTLIDAMPDVIFTKDLRGRMGISNLAHVRFAGAASEEELMGKTAFELYPAELAEVYARDDAEVIAYGKPIFNREEPCVKRDGADCWLITTKVPLRNQAGEIIGLVGVSRDVTDRKLVEAAQRASELRYRTLFEYAPDGIVIADQQSYYLDANSSLCRMLGYARDELIGLHASNIVAPAEVPLIGSALRVLNTQSEYQREWQFRRKDGSIFPAEVIATKMPDGNLLAVIRDITERKRAESAVRESEQRLRGILDTMFVFVGLMNLDGEIVEVNQAPLAAAGLKREDVLGKTVAESYWFSDSPAGQEQVRQALARAAQGEIMRDDYLIRIAGGGHLTIDTTFAPLRDASGQITQIVGSAVDITERKRIEGRFRRLVDSNAQGVIFWNTKGQIAGANDAFLRLVGYTREDLEAGRLGWATMTPPEYAHLDRRALEEMAAKGVCTPFEKEYLRKDGSRVPILLGAAIFEDSPNEGVCFVIDVTERKQAAEALNAERNLLRTLIDSLPDVIFTKDLQGRLGISNAAHVRFAGAATEADLFGKTVFDLYPPELAGAYHQDDMEVISSGRPIVNREEPRVNRDGADVWLITTKVPLRNQAGETVGLIGVSRDVTERKQAEEEIRRLNAELEQRVIKRTAQLEAANQELEAFSYSVSHDLRAPLRAVDGFSRAVEEDYGPQLPAEGQRYLRTIREGAQRMGRLIDDLLAFSRLSRLPLNQQTVDMGRLVKEVLDDLAGEREGRNVELRIGGLPPCAGDATLLKQVWINLLSNAFKYTRRREAAVVEIGGTLGAAGAGAGYFVRDNGTGFDMRYADKLFGVFQRLHRAEDFEGTGVGLAIVQRVIHRHGGRVWADAALDRGATFHFTLNERTHP